MIEMYKIMCGAREELFSHHSARKQSKSKLSVEI